MFALPQCYKIMVPLSDFALQVFITDLYSFNLINDAEGFTKSLVRSRDLKKRKEEDERLRGKRKSNYYGSLINKIIENYAPEAESSIAARIDEKKCELEKVLLNIGGLNDEQRKAIYEQLLKSYKDRLTQKRDELLGLPQSRKITEKKISRPSVTLSSDNKWYFRNKCEEDGYYGKLSKYIRALCEEYAKLPDYKREQIFFAREVATINDAITNGKRLIITPTEHNSTKKMDHQHILIPYKIIGGHVVGYTRRAEKKEGTPTYICPFRLSGLHDVKLEKEEKEYSLSEEQVKAIQEAIDLCDVAFCRQKNGDEPLRRIKIQFTDTGLKQYSRETTSILRPRMEDVQDQHDVNRKIFSFICRPGRAELFFKRFGKEAVIVEVASLSNKRDEAATAELRNRFIKFYSAALKGYGVQVNQESAVENTHSWENEHER